MTDRPIPLAERKMNQFKLMKGAKLWWYALQVFDWIETDEVDENGNPFISIDDDGEEGVCYLDGDFVLVGISEWDLFDYVIEKIEQAFGDWTLSESGGRFSVRCDILDGEIMVWESEGQFSQGPQGSVAMWLLTHWNKPTPGELRMEKAEKALKSQS